MNASTSAVRPDVQSDAPPSMRTCVTCTIIAYNEVDRIHRTIESVKGLVDEILVIDSGSTDDTVKLCESLGASVTHNPWPGYGPQKRLAEDLAKHDWILNLDADEQLSDELREEIGNLITNPIPSERSFSVPRADIYPNRDSPAPFAYKYRCVRLYNRKVTRFRDSLAHDTVLPTKDLVVLNGLVYHRSIRGFAQIIRKSMLYSELQKREGKEARRLSPLRVIIELPLQFFRYYVLRRHMYGGAAGFAYAVALSIGRLSRLFILSGW
jgi:glycosyltransferase involved in cell wall biosynthesis